MHILEYCVSYIYIVNILFQSVVYLHSLKVYFYEQKLLILMKSSLSDFIVVCRLFFFLLLFCFCFTSREILPTSSSESYCFLLEDSEFKVLYLGIKSILYYVCV